MTAAASPTCPICGAALQAVTNVESPPWLCVADAQAFYACELTTAARATYRPAFRDFHRQSHTLHLAAVAERDARRGNH